MRKCGCSLERGADLTAKSELGDTALDFAKRRKDAPMIAALGTAAAGVAAAEAAAPAASSDASSHAPGDMRTAIERSIALLQKSDVQFVKSTGCISCHHDVLPQMLVEMARGRHIAVDQEIAERQFNAVVSYLDDRRDRALQGLEIAGGPDTLSYLLADLDAHGYAPTETTDAWARYLAMLQLPDGRWRVTVHRPPIESSDIEVTAMSLRALCGTRRRRSAPNTTVACRARRRVARDRPRPHERRSRRSGCSASRGPGAPRAPIADAVRELRAAQRPTAAGRRSTRCDSDAYATGQALVALQIAGGVPATDAAYQRGVAYLRKTQHARRIVAGESARRRAAAAVRQRLPGGRDQWISAAGTSWAAMAMVLTVGSRRRSSSFCCRRRAVPAFLDQD